MDIRSDVELIQIVDTATADAARRAGAWLKCRPGCTQCCIGVFAVSQLDAERLRAGWKQLRVSEPERATAVHQRAEEAMRRLSTAFPGDPVTGILHDSAEEAFEDFANDEPCPALDPLTGTCDLYAHRPMTCRVFGPPIRSEDGIGVCELCFQGASEEEVLNAELKIEWTDTEEALNAEAVQQSGVDGETIIAFVLAGMKSTAP